MSMDNSVKEFPELKRKLQVITRKCRGERLLRCWSRFGIVTFMATAITTLLLAIMPAGEVTGAILLSLYLLVEIWALWRWLLAPLRHPITLEQVALYVDERHPELENRIVSALEFSDHPQEGASDWLIEQFLIETQPMMRSIPLADIVDSAVSNRRKMIASLMLALSVGTIVLFGQFWFSGLSFVLPDTLARRPSLPFTVEPGNARVRIGDNQMVWVRSDKANRKLRVRWRLGEGPWQTDEMDQSGTEKTYYHQFSDIQNDILYEVQYGRLKSETFKLTAWTPPEVDSIDLAYTYPEYLGIETREVPNSGDITALEGTEVEMFVWTNKKLALAEMVFKNGDRRALKQSTDVLWTTKLVLDHDDTYRIELTDLEDYPSEFNPEYDIKVDKDRAPDIRIQFPRGDSEVTMLEEVPFDFEVSDDYGFAEYGIQYEITGRDPVRIPLGKSGTKMMAAEGHHEIYLEDLNLETGDFITWTVWARDAKPGRAKYEELGDPFFLEIRPFQMRYQEAISGAGGQGGSQGEDDPLVKAKEIIIATWNLRRDFPILLDEEFYERKDIIIEEQEGLLKDLSEGGPMGGDSQPNRLRLNRALTESIDAIRSAELPEPGAALSEAAASERESYGILLKMKPKEAQVQQNRNQGGGGGGGSQRQDISALEMDRNRNFYEDENLTQGMQEAAEEVLRKIKEISQRQEIVNEEIAKLISEMENATEEEKKRLKRRLERLQDDLKENLAKMDEVNRELSSDQLSNEQVRESRESLREARQQVNRSMDQLEQGRYQQARASGERALDALGDIEEYLQQFSRKGAAENMRQLQERLERLQQQQENIAQKTEEMKEQHLSPSFEDQEASEAASDNILDEKKAVMKEFRDLMNEAGDLAERSKDSQELMARELGDWLRETSREGIIEAMESAENLVKYGVWESAAEEEARIAQKLADAAENLEQVAGHLIEDELDAMQMALQNLDELMGGQRDASGTQGATGENQESGTPSVRLGVREEMEPGEEGQASSQTPSEDGQPGASEEAQEGQRGQQGQQQGNNQGGDSAASGGNTGGNPWAPFAGRTGTWYDNLDMRQFTERDYREWLERLRDTEALLPLTSEYRRDVTRIRENIEAIRRQYRDRKILPKRELFLQKIARPLAETADRLHSEIERMLDEKEFVLVDEGDIPERYRERVATYFKNLSEAESEN